MFKFVPLSGNSFMCINWYGKSHDMVYLVSKKKREIGILRFMYMLHTMIDCYCSGRLNVSLRIDIRLPHCALCTCLFQLLIGFLFLYLELFFFYSIWHIFMPKRKNYILYVKIKFAKEING